MGKIAFVFPGQGAQYGGMGKALYESNAPSAAVFDILEGIRPGITELCFSGSPEALSQTRHTQPAMFAVEMAAAAALTGARIFPDSVAGFSLGEIAALTYSGSVSLENGFRLVCRRAELMQADTEKAGSAMAAVIKLDEGQVNALCAPYANVFPVNYNSPFQITVAGLKEELDQFSLDVRRAGGRALPLKVGGGFHSKFMAGAAEGFAKELEGCRIERPKYKLYSNCTGAPYGEEVKPLLSRQICSPVRWHDIVRNMISDGVDTFIELGPGTTLCTLIHKTDPNVKTFNVEDLESLEKTIEGVRPC